MKTLDIAFTIFYMVLFVGLVFFSYEPSKVVIGCAFLISAISFLKSYLNFR
jgi:hypothetical protein